MARRSRKRLRAESRRAAIIIILAVLGMLLFGLLWRLLVGPIHRHERHLRGGVISTLGLSRVRTALY